MKINKNIITRLVRESVKRNVYNVSEVVAYSPGMGNLEKVDYPECKIEIPPIFKKAFLENKGADANTVRSIMGKEFSSLGQTQTGASEKGIAVIESVFSDNNVNNIMKMVNKIANIGGVPAVYCVILQKAIDSFAKLVEVYHEKVDTEEGKKQPVFIKIITDFIATIDRPVPSDFATTMVNNNVIGSSEYKAPIAMLYFGDYLQRLARQHTVRDYLKKTVTTGTGTIDSDIELKDQLALSFTSFDNAKDDIINTNASTANNASDFVGYFFSLILRTRIPNLVRIEVIDKMNAYEKTLNRQAADRYRQEIKQKILQLSNSLYANSFNFATDEIVQEHFQVLDKKEFYKETTELYKMIKTIVEKL